MRQIDPDVVALSLVLDAVEDRLAELTGDDRELLLRACARLRRLRVELAAGEDLRLTGEES